MLCDTCKNKYICKHYDYIKNIEIDISVQIGRCELYSNNNSQPIVHNPDKRSLYKQPLPSRPIEEDDVEEDDEVGERIFVDIDTYNEPQNTSIVDLIMKGDGIDD